MAEHQVPKSMMKLVACVAVGLRESQMNPTGLEMRDSLVASVIETVADRRVAGLM